MWVSLLDFDSLTQQLHPRSEDDEVGGAAVPRPYFICASVICGLQVPAIASAVTLRDFQNDTNFTRMNVRD